MKKNLIRQILPMLIFILYSLAFTGEAKSGECLSYGPAKVKLTGILAEKIFPGPPEFESIEKGDRPETVWVLKLKKPVCVNANEEYDLSFVREAGIIAIQLVPYEEGYKVYKHLVNKKVVAEGELFHRETGYHYTMVLLSVDSMKPAK